MVIFILILSVLIVVHELGHFLVAKRLGVKVEKFSLGFGPKLLSRQFGQTEYLVCAIPFGGYVKMAGDTPEEYQGHKDEYFAKKPGERARIVFAGPLFNYLLAFVCLWLVFILGFPRVTNKVGELIEGMPAVSAGVEKEDVIFAVDGVAVEFWDDLTKKIHAKAGQSVRLGIQRADRKLELEITPQDKSVETIWGKKVSVGLIGIRPSEEFVKVRYGVGKAFVKAGENLFQMTQMTLKAIFYLIVGTMSFKDSVTGPLGIFFITSNAAKIGFSAILHVVGILSMSLAIFNLLPLPILDGGHIMFMALEKLRRKPLTPKAEERLNNIGMSFLIILTVFIFCNDLVRYGYWDKVLTFFSR